jgi:hypothetical protein
MDHIGFSDIGFPHPQGDKKMRKQRTTLLAGIAALALIAGAGAASAQQTGNEEHGAKQPSAAAHEMNKTGGAMGQNSAAPTGTATKMDRNAVEQERGRMDQNAARENRAGGKMGQNEQDRNKGMTGREDNDRATSAQDRDRNAQRESTAEHNDRSGQAAERNDRNAAARDRDGLKGLQGNARVNVQINDHQRMRIRETVIDARGAPRIGHVAFNVTVGTVLPRSGVRIVPVTPALVEIDPSWRGLRYFIYEQDLVLVDPATMTIVAVVNV